jgi:hypothetical protein
MDDNINFRHRAASKKKRIADPTKRCNITGE